MSPLPRTGALLVQVSPALVTTCDAAGLWRRRSKWTFRAPVSCAFFLRLYLTLAGACAQAPSGGGVGAGSLRCSGSGIQTAAGPYSGAGTARADEPSMSTSVCSQGRPQKADFRTRECRFPCRRLRRVPQRSRWSRGGVLDGRLAPESWACLFPSPTFPQDLVRVGQGPRCWGFRGGEAQWTCLGGHHPCYVLTEPGARSQRPAWPPRGDSGGLPREGASLPWCRVLALIHV